MTWWLSKWTACCRLCRSIGRRVGPYESTSDRTEVPN